MARCQMLLQENEELGKTIASGRTAKLEGEIALQKTLVTEMKNNQSGMIHGGIVFSVDLTITILWANSADDKLMIFFLFFPRKHWVQFA